MSVQDYLSSACEVRRNTGLDLPWSEVIVYDQSAPALTAVPGDCFLHVLLDKLCSAYRGVHLLLGDWGGGGEQRKVRLCLQRYLPTCS